MAETSAFNPQYFVDDLDSQWRLWIDQLHDTIRRLSDEELADLEEFVREQMPYYGFEEILRAAVDEEQWRRRQKQKQDREGHTDDD
jgi:hypothetical protein